MTFDHMPHHSGRRLHAYVERYRNRVPFSVERELAELRASETRLKSALSQVEALLAERSTPAPDRLPDQGRQGWREEAAARLAHLTSRQRQILEMVLAGCPSKNIAADLSISQRTVENHRAEIMKRSGARSIPELARLALVATWNDTDESITRKGAPYAVVKVLAG